jgi:hypothetical protein
VLAQGGGGDDFDWLASLCVDGGGVVRQRGPRPGASIPASELVLVLLLFVSRLVISLDLIEFKHQYV